MTAFRLQRISLKLAEKVREIATRQGRVPFDTGDLRKSHVVQPDGATGAVVGSNLPYARAVHDGRPALVIRPRRAKALRIPGLGHPVKAVRQSARQGRPWLREAAEMLPREPLRFLEPDIGPDTVRVLEAHLSKLPNLTIRRQ